MKINHLYNKLLSLAVLLLLASCSPVQVSDYSGNTPKLVAEQFFNGELTAHGVVKNRAGRVIRRFNADIVAYWKDGVGTLEEDFVFDDGEQQRRVWTLVAEGDGRYKATAGDVIGESVAEVAGNSMFLNYVLRIPYDGDTIDVSVDDRMYLVNDKILINESTMKKFGFRVGEIVLVIQKR